MCEQVPGHAALASSPGLEFSVVQIRAVQAKVNEDLNDAYVAEVQGHKMRSPCDNGSSLQLLQADFLKTSYELSALASNLCSV